MSSGEDRPKGRWDAPPYETNRVIRIPTAVPELGVEPGDPGVIDVAYRGRGGNLLLNVEVPKEGGISAGFLDVEVIPGESPDSADTLHVVGHSVMLGWTPDRSR